jgi:type II secretory ATPase GspE/PulE/Tfp pilus assembly ATPase PilB-like protein
MTNATETVNSEVLMAPNEFEAVLRDFPGRLHLVGSLLYTLLPDTRDPVMKSQVSHLIRAAQQAGFHLEVVPVSPNQMAKLQRGVVVDQIAAGRDTDIIETAKSILRQGQKDNASDIHLVSVEGELRVSYRIDGDLIPAHDRVLDTEAGERLLSSFYVSMSDVADSTWKPKQAQDGSIAKQFLPSGVISARIATRPMVHGPLMVIRLQYPGKEIKDFRALDLEPTQIESLERIARLPDGIVIFLGTTGSGKTTTMQKVLTRIHNLWEGQRHVLTIEDPIEIPIPGANQTASTKEDFAKSVSQAMRLDPDIMMVGEMRDSATANAAAEAALTGHLVFATLHAKSPVHAVPRLQELGIKPTILADPEILAGLVNLTLVKRLCEECRVEVDKKLWPEWPQWKKAMDSQIGASKIFVKNPNGCPTCQYRGTKGRVQICEIIETDERYLQIATSGTRREANEYTRSKGNLTIYDHALKRILRGEVDIRDVEAVIGELPARFKTSAPPEAPGTLHTLGANTPRAHASVAPAARATTTDTRDAEPTSRLAACLAQQTQQTDAPGAVVVPLRN